MGKQRQFGRGMTQAVCLLALAFAAAPHARASATLLLEEPYGTLGFFTATGHAAVYLSGVCAESPVVLRPCAQGETGIVLSRYNGVAGYDWIAVPLIPYLYAVENAEDVPLFADAKMVAFLRERYRRKYLNQVAPDLAGGKAPGGNWYELLGSSYDRAIYGFEIETSREQDAALIRKYNMSPNQSHFRTVSRNCADFAKDVINFYYPKALHRSFVADVGMTTPKQMAKTMLLYSDRHPELQFTRTTIPQVPGTAARSSNIHGVVDSFFNSKKYIVPSAIVSPIFAGCVAAVYVGTGSEHFDPARNALVFVPGDELDLPLGREDRRAYAKELSHLLAQARVAGSGPHGMKAWERTEAKASFGFDEQAGPLLRMQVGSQTENVGVAAGNVFEGDATPALARELLEARLLAELHDKAPHGVSEREVTRDWNLLQQAIRLGEDEAAAQSALEASAGASRVERSSENLP